jgi:hypothetical protein
VFFVVIEITREFSLQHNHNHQLKMTLLVVSEDIVEYVLFNFIDPRDYLSILLTCSTFWRCLHNNSSYKYCRLLMSSNMNRFDDIPPYDFLVSTTTINIRNILHYKYNVPLPIEILKNFDFSVGKELLKIFKFFLEDVYAMDVIYQEMLGDIACIFRMSLKPENYDVESIIFLLEKYAEYMPTVLYTSEDMLLSRTYVDFVADVPEVATRRHLVIQILNHVLDRCDYESVMRIWPIELLDDKSLILEAVTYNSCVFINASLRLKDDPEVALAAVSQDGSLLQVASENIQKNINIVHTALRQRGTLRYLEELKSLTKVFDPHE